MNNFVPYQESLELKELGFNEPCLAFYEEEKNKLVTFHSDSYQEVKGNTCLFKQVNAPTFSQAFCWFKQKYNIDGWVQLFNYEFDEHTLPIADGSWSYYIFQNNEYLYDDVDFQNREEAELACLKKIIEIVKQKQ